MVLPSRCQRQFATATLLVFLFFDAGCSPEPQPNAPDTVVQPPSLPVVETGLVPEPEGVTPKAKPGPIPSPWLTEAQLDEGWIALFDGKTLFGWHDAGSANWRVEDGTIVVDSGENGLLCTTTQFGDYVLRLDFRADSGTNSGVFLHTPPQVENPGTQCYELNIADATNPFPTGSLVQRARAEGDFQSDDWQTYEVQVSGDEVTVKLNQEQIVQYTDPAPLRRGYIGLQHKQGKVAFRNVRLKPLGMQSLFDGKTLALWNEYPEMASKFTVTADGLLNVKDGRGQLETKQAYGDFVLQLQCVTHASGLNSGVFFRCIPGDTMMGYESQISNAVNEGDRRMPSDHGTGGFFRFQPARFVVADDQQWFHKTLIVDGSHMAAWVNGLQVSDWTDVRDAHENPRKGLRLEPGTIMIQGHDPTTDISFKGLQITEMSARQP